MKNLTFTKEALTKLVGSVVESSVRAELEKRAIHEKEKQDSASGDLFADTDDSAKDDDNNAKDNNVDNNKNSSKTKDVEPREGEIDLDMIIDKLNSIRAGHSFKDDNVSISMKRYFEDLDDSERLALYAFLKGISQIVTGEVPGDEAMEPDDVPSPGVKITHDKDKKSSSSPDNKKQSADTKNLKVVKHVSVSKPQSSSSKPKEKGSGENTASPTPIVPKSR